MAGGGGVIPDTSKIQQTLNLQSSSITPRNSERPLSLANTPEKRGTALRSDHRAIHPFPLPGARRGRDPAPPAAPVPSVPCPASGAAASGGSAATALSSRHRAAARESGGARGALLPTGGLMPAWGAASQQESLWREERSGGGSPAAVTAGCHGGPAPLAGCSRVERQKCAALSRTPRGTGRTHPGYCLLGRVPPAPRPLPEAAGPRPQPGSAGGPRALWPRRPRQRSARPAIPYIPAAAAINSPAPPEGAGPGAARGGFAAVRGPAVTCGSAARPRLPLGTRVGASVRRPRRRSRGPGPADPRRGNGPVRRRRALRWSGAAAAAAAP